ncbi:MAG: DUF6089 family protein [Bacteroidales bacterium]|jgi:hypothetical protein|nr:DUF6089 family protein [Bacteroidales bacterium]
MQKNNRKIIIFINIIVIAFVVSINNKLQAQSALEIGVQAGASYYMGDINLSRHFYSPHPNFGGFIKFHFSYRSILKVGVFSTHLSAADKDFNNVFQQTRNASFNTPYTELNLCYEVSFLPFIVGQQRKHGFSPYLSLGVATYIANASNHKLGFAIPVGFGLKKALGKRLVLGLEWSFHRAFSDELDNLTGEDINRNYSENYGYPIDSPDPAKQTGFRFNKDWQVYGVITLSYAFRIGGLTCHAY